MSDITENDRKLIEQLRQENKDMLTPKFDTDYNILRFIKGWNYDMPAVSNLLRRHLKSRKAFKVDELDKLEDDAIIKEHFPGGILGPNGKDGRIVMIDPVGRTDIEGILKSVQATDFIRYRLKFFERLYKAMNEQEALTGKQSGTVYIFDLEGITFDPFLLPTLNGAYRILWGTVMINYPEWISVILLVNVPTFFNILWKAFSQFMPDNTKDKLKVLGNDWKTELLEYIDPKCLPVHWGGKMVDENGDPMCRSKIVVPQGKIPPSLYWKNSGKYKELPDDQVKSRTVGAGVSSQVAFFVIEPGTILYYYIHCPDDFTFAIYYTDDVKERDVAKMDEIFPHHEVPGGLAPDQFDFVCERAGAYHIKFGNEKAWMFSVTLKYKCDFKNKDGSPATVVSLDEE